VEPPGPVTDITSSRALAAKIVKAEQAFDAMVADDRLQGGPRLRPQRGGRWSIAS
jgi:hypothetical protein